MASIYAYLWVFAGNWWAFMTAGPFVLDEALKRWPSAKNWMDRWLPPERRKKFEIWMMVLGVFLAGFFAWQEEHVARLAAERSQAATAPPQPRPLKRFIAYGNQILSTTWTPNDGLQLHGYYLTAENAGDETSTISEAFLNVEVDGTSVLRCRGNRPVIVPQRQGATFPCTPISADSVPISADAKAFVVEFEIDYDTLPESGIRKSYRKFRYAANWANGKQSAPLFAPEPLDEWER